MTPEHSFHYLVARVFKVFELRDDPRIVEDDIDHLVMGHHLVGEAAHSRAISLPIPEPAPITTTIMFISFSYQLLFLWSGID